MNILELLAERTVLFDGGLGSALIARGLPTGAGPERWNLERPEEVREVHRAYFEAGADVVQTNTFGCNLVKLESEGLGDREEDINGLGAELAVGIRPRDRFVCGDMGPTGKLLTPHGALDPETAEEAYARQALLLLGGGVDFLAVETIFQLAEAEAALRGIRLVNEGPVLVSLTFERKKRGFFTIMGESPKQAAETLGELGVSILGANCTLTTGDMLALAEEFRQATDLPLVMQPNAGQPQASADGGPPSYEFHRDDFLDNMMRMADVGINGLGGCCGTDPGLIADLRQRLDQRQGGGR
jgi:5-methyltetrahydrofolate--homocysteine methyltransferase